MPPLVSAILPVHDRAPWIARAIESVLRQTYTAFELLVVDDGSTDGTATVLETFGARLTVIRQPPRGAYAARNAALSRARGELVAFIDSDDAWLPDRLERQVPLLASDDVGLVFGDTVHVTGRPGAMRPMGRTSFGVTPPRRGRVAAHFAWGNFVPTTTVLVRRRVIEQTGPFDETEPVSADFLKWFQVAARCGLDFVDGPVAHYTVHAEGISADLERSLRARIRLFSSELARTTDPALAGTLRRLLFNLSLHLAAAVLRRYAGANALTIVTRVAWQSAGPWRAPGWMAGFVYHRALRARHRAGVNEASTPGRVHAFEPAAGRGDPRDDYGTRARR